MLKDYFNRFERSGGHMKPKFNNNYKGVRCRVYLVREGENDEVIKLNNSSDVYNLVKDELANSDREMLLSVMLTVKNQLIGVETVSIGSISATSMLPREVFKSAILANAVGIILCHNHPSDELVPSNEDIKFTKLIVDAGELLGIKVLDHLIVSNKGYQSLRDCCEFPN
jgi:DNA repair protein RadC